MPVNETKLLADKSRNELGIHLGPIIVNAVPEEVIPHDLMAEYAQMKKILESSENLSPDILSTLKLVELGIKRRELALTHINKLKALLPNETFLEIPFLPDWNWDRNTIDKIAEILQQKLS
jgi:hypothetical protein